MDDKTACRIIAALADGVDPATGETFPPHAPWQDPDVVRALTRALRAFESTAPARRSRSGLPGNAGKPWAADEDRQLLEEHEQGQSLADMAAAHARTVAGIEARLEKLGRLDPAARTTARRFPVRPGGDADAGAQHS